MKLYSTIMQRWLDSFERLKNSKLVIQVSVNATAFPYKSQYFGGIHLQKIIYAIDHGVSASMQGVYYQWIATFARF